jgi:hypothetical protein
MNPKPKNHHVELLILRNILMAVSAVGGVKNTYTKFFLFTERET